MIFTSNRPMYINKAQSSLMLHDNTSIVS